MKSFIVIINGETRRFFKDEIYHIGYKDEYKHKGGYFNFSNILDVEKDGDPSYMEYYLMAEGNIKVFVENREFYTKNTNEEYENGAVAEINDIAFIEKLEVNENIIKPKIVSKLNAELRSLKIDNVLKNSK